MIITSISVTFVPNEPLKQSRQGSTLDTFEYRKYDKEELCVVACLNEYLCRREKRTSATLLLLTYGKPYKPAAIDSIRRWVKELFTEANIFEFTPRSCPAASTGKANYLNVSIEDILKKGCWKNAQNFYKYYNKEILFQADDADFQRILQ